MIYIFRLSRLLFRCRVPLLPWLLKAFNRVAFSVSLPPSVSVGRNVTFGYQGLGIVVHKRAVIGNNVRISPNVVIGGRGGDGVPVIEDDVFVGAGACILGAVTVGKGAKVGANSVVLEDVPGFASAIGNPARIVPDTHRPSHG
ncbi:serine O-acetyltransferase [Paraburkholderia sp. BL6665CI2N2]|uniref:serine O-acetyltransferase n=1 Tax=Paraburkholderia sp. BL6665CI2N2 TaxID=1938806 RepID=UPI0010662122|nr:DapH/DapD/GlmU-related protein [Paraburkholderia sp. BL6665CI2N2]TDY16884.1 serine O-acetyltransferase [Paraburkholderia sp. BL6665CI2N2]